MKDIPAVIKEFLALPDADGFSIYDKFAYLIKSVDGDSYYFYTQLVEDEFISEELGYQVYKAISNNIAPKDVLNWYKLV